MEADEINFEWEFCEYCDVDHMASDTPDVCQDKDLKAKIKSLKNAIDQKDIELSDLRLEAKRTNAKLTKTESALSKLQDKFDKIQDAHELTGYNEISKE